MPYMLHLASNWHAKRDIGVGKAVHHFNHSAFGRHPWPRCAAHVYRNRARLVQFWMHGPSQTLASQVDAQPLFALLPEKCEPSLLRQVGHVAHTKGF